MAVAFAAAFVSWNAQRNWPQQSSVRLAERPELVIRPAPAAVSWPQYQDADWGYEVRYPPMYIAVPGEGHGQVVRFYKKGKPQICGGFSCPGDFELYAEGTAVLAAKVPSDAKGRLIAYFTDRWNKGNTAVNPREAEMLFASGRPILVNGVSGLLVETPDDPETPRTAFLIQLDRKSDADVLVSVQITTLSARRQLEDPAIFEQVLSTYKRI